MYHHLHSITTHAHGTATPSVEPTADSISQIEQMGLKEEFDEYAEKAKTLPESTTNENKLILYGLYKQATVGAVNTSRPGIFNMRDRAKWDAWKAVEGKSKEEAMGDYVTKVKQLLEEAGAST
ncbi:acyl-CoA-binding protein [Prunus yedoensis var. nudiflora]|uniref:Acyl-CoA-binding protein n=5 Tax=Prunus TaxID=3754 RepID=A0A314Z987_PRUYE|nr:acyl-CoA-binding protein [Prunus yedoensis var. nudiflora]